MRPLSMTGFGSGKNSRENRTWLVDVKTVNHRFLDIRVKMPRPLAALEEKIRQTVSALHGRGRVEVTVEIRGDLTGESTLQVDMNLARQYYACLQEISKDLQLDGKPDLADIISLPDIISRQDQPPDIEMEWQSLKPALDEALSVCLHMREQEGEALQRDLLARLRFFSDTVDEVANQLPEIRKKRQENLKKKLGKLLNGVEIDPIRLAQEVAVMADRSDVTEELVRLRSHVSQFETFLCMDEAVGRRLDFLLQEFLREVNTLVSKTGNSEVAHKTVTLKSEIEKMREQVQNIE